MTKKGNYPKFKEALKAYSEKRNEFFNQIWKTRKHVCQSCNKYLGSEPKTYYFDHLLEKNKYKELEFVGENIYICCFECHAKKSNGYPTEKHKLAIEIIKTKYNL